MRHFTSRPFCPSVSTLFLPTPIQVCSPRHEGGRQVKDLSHVASNSHQTRIKVTKIGLISSNQTTNKLLIINIKSFVRGAENRLEIRCPTRLSYTPKEFLRVIQQTYQQASSEP